MNVIDATQGYEAWLAREVRLLDDDLLRKHELMAEAAFPFLRATYYRWAQIWKEHAGALAKLPSVLAVGDLHVENFGTWRDAEGRLVWGVNDFDEVAELPLTLDLTRLAVSAALASDHHGLGVSRPQVARILLQGYREGVEAGGRPFVLEESHPQLRDMMRARLKDPRPFWERLSSHPEFEGRKPKTAISLLMRLLPHGVASLRIIHRVAGLGSLGRQRLTVIGELDGGLVAREVKQLAPPASYWAIGKGSSSIRYGELLKSAIRCQDPFLRQQDNWVGRRLSPSNSRVELVELPKVKDLDRLLHAMGFETGNLHLSSVPRKQLLNALGGITAAEFAKVARSLESAVIRDWKAWKAR